jgi:SAM-dependent methyltransferase
MTAPENPWATGRPADGEVTCPCCDEQFPRFLPYGLRARPGAKCPRCGAKKRHRLLWLFLRDRTNFFTDRLRVLHFAPERCFKAFASLPNLDYVTADFHPGRAMLAIDITAIALPTGSFDAILCSHVLEHVPDDRRAMRELFRMLKPRGWAAVMVPLERGRAETFEDPRIVSPEEREQVFGHHDHVRIYGQDFKRRLESTGFAVRVHRYAKELGPEAVKRHSLPRKDDIYLCIKPSGGNGQSTRDVFGGAPPIKDLLER